MTNLTFKSYAFRCREVAFYHLILVETFEFAYFACYSHFSAKQNMQGF